MQPTLAFRDGNYLPKAEIRIGLDDLGYERGFAVFDYCRVRSGRITFLNDHLERLNHSQSILQLDEPQNMELVKEVMMHLLKKNALADGYLKMIVSARMTDNKTKAILTVYQDEWHAYDPEMFDKGVGLIIAEFEKPFPAYKTTFYLGSLKEFHRMESGNAADILFYAGDQIRECARCNIFIVKNGLIYTPEKNILNGVTRKHVIRCARQQLMVIEKDITMRELLQADEVFISSTTRNIMPVIKIEDSLISNGLPGPVTKELMPLFELYCNQYDTH